MNTESAARTAAHRVIEQKSGLLFMWASDFPHTDSTWPYSQALLAKHTTDLTEEEKNWILHDNVAELYHLAI